MKDTLKAISLSLPLQEKSDIMIKYWGPIDHCDLELSKAIFGKFLTHIEKKTIAESIYYMGI